MQLESDLAFILDSLSAAEEQNASAREQIENISGKLEAERALYQQLLDEKQQEISAIRSDGEKALEASRAENSAAREEISRLTERLENEQERYAALDSEYQASVSASAADKERLETSLTVSRSEIAASREEVARLNGVLDTERQVFERSLADCREVVRQRENEIASLNTALVQKTAESAERQRAVEENLERIAVLQQNCAAEKAEKEALQKRNTHLLLRWALCMDDWCSRVKKFMCSSTENDSGEVEK